MRPGVPAGRSKAGVLWVLLAASPSAVAGATLTLALLLLAAVWRDSGGYVSLGAGPFGATALTTALVTAVVTAYLFPIYIRHNTKICVFTVPVYLLTVFLQPPLAAAAAGLGIFMGEMAVKSRHANDLSDVAVHVGRWTIIVWLGSVVAHLSVGSSTPIQHVVPFAGAAAILWTGDIITVPLAIAPYTHERVDRIVLTCVRSGGLAEAAQYALGVAGALLIFWHAWTLALLVVPTVFLYLLGKKEIDAETFQLLESMADAVDLRDPYTVEHSRRVTEVAARILSEMGRGGQEADLILAAARVHDIGKTVIPDRVLLKQGMLTAEERAAMEMHAEHGAELLKRYPDFARVVDMVRHHHERWDGTGYPGALRQTTIPFGARVVAVADALVAMTSDRAYRQAVPLGRVAEILADGRGRQWDPQLVDATLRAIAKQQGAGSAVPPARDAVQPSEATSTAVAP